MIFRSSYDRAKGDDLSPLLDLYDRAQAAALIQQQAAAVVHAVEEAINA